MQGVRGLRFPIATVWRLLSLLGVTLVMVLQHLEGLSDRKAVERYCFDNCWRYAAGVSGRDTKGWINFSHTVTSARRRECRGIDVATVSLSPIDRILLPGRGDLTRDYTAVKSSDTQTSSTRAVWGLSGTITETLKYVNVERTRNGVA